MSLNFSEEQSKNNSVTFHNLETLIGYWSSEIQENQNVFSLQSEELTKLMFGICDCRDKLKGLYERIIIAKYLQENIDQYLDYIWSRQSDIERMVTSLEKDIDRSKMCKCETSVDVYRKNTYKVAESLNSTYLEYLEGIEELQIHTGQIKQNCTEMSNVEYIAELLQHQLQQLENIEMKIYDMKNRLTQAEYYKHLVLASLRIKENKYYFTII